MSCPDCEQFGREGKVYYYRLGAANIGIIACEKHFVEVRKRIEDYDVLRNAVNELYAMLEKVNDPNSILEN